MCGFVGFLSADGSLQPDLEVWSNLIRHRGPDQSGQVVCQEFGVGTRRLSILDLSDAGSQPMQSERYILGFNGEIYNHMSLRDELELHGAVTFRSHSDTETILRAMEHWGVRGTLERLNGMYALTVWDKESHELTLARDPLGIKPLYYLESGSMLYFGSEVRALRQFARGKISPEGIALYLYFGFVPAPYSLLDGVHKLRPGEMLTFGPSGQSSARIVPTAWSMPVPLFGNPRERLEYLRLEVEAAIQRQLLSDVPVGVFLSGGVDSTIIASVAAEHQPGLHSFSLRPEGIGLDPGVGSDADIAANHARRLGLTHQEVVFSPEDVVREVDRFLTQIDEPVAELYAAAELLLSRAARAAGVKVVLTGHGGDEVFLGYPTYDAVFRGDLYNMVPLLGPALRLVSQTPWFSPESRRNLLGAASVWRQPVMERYAIVSGVHFSLDDVTALTGLEPEYVHSIVEDILLDTNETISHLPRGENLHNAERFARMDMLLMVPEHYNTRLDRTTMNASIEARVPLQDLELIGFVMQFSHQELRQGGLKGMLKTAFADVLPPEVVRRPKQTFQAPMLSWITGPLAPWVTERIASMPSAAARCSVDDGLSPDTTRRAYRSWSLALLEGWRDALALEY